MFDLYAEVAVRMPVSGLFTYSIPDAFRETAGPGIRVKVPFRGKTQDGIIVRIHNQTPDFKTLSIEKADSIPLLNEYQLKLGKWIANRYLASEGECYFKMFPQGKRIPPERKILPYSGNTLLELNEEQKNTYLAVTEDLNKNSQSSVHLIHGITGSGKTEIYIHLIHEVIRSGRGAILLVPEISLTVQLIDRLKIVFSDELALMHSGMKGSERFASYVSLLREERRIAVGTRSAVFAPVKNLGLIILDEEHDSSYREHSSPKYDARIIAHQRCTDSGGVLVLGSATPTVETCYRARKPENKTIIYHRLNSRATGAELPIVKIIPSGQNPLSGELIEQINLNLKNKEQTILLLNRRGYSPYLYCRKCAKSEICPNCSVSLNFHKNGKMICHYCGYNRINSGKCSTCGESISRVGFGTQKLEEYIFQIFPDIRMERLDTDSVSDNEHIGRSIQNLLSGNIDILLGTQMIAKGLDAPNVTLVGVLQADSSLHLPDFRSQERVFSLLTQVAGRAGRGEKKGRVIFEALDVDNPILKFARAQDYDSFYREEIQFRHNTWYPPFSRLIRVLFRSESEKQAEITCQNFADLLKSREDSFQSADGFHTMLLGPAPAPMEKLHGKFRYHLLIKTVKMEFIREILRTAIPEFKKKMSEGVFMEVDFEAQDLL